jgi:hypothetical protein
MLFPLSMGLCEKCHEGTLWRGTQEQWGDHKMTADIWQYACSKCGQWTLFRERLPKEKESG